MADRTGSSPKTAIEKILARAAGVPNTEPGQLVTCSVDRVVLIDFQFPSFNSWQRPLKIADPAKVSIILDHAVPAPSVPPQLMSLVDAGGALAMLRRDGYLPPV
jgi:homoaconitase/3-isopropylmalate dehydratase large subunit